MKAFAAAHRIPILQLKKPDRSRWDDRKLDHVRPYLERAERNGRCGVVAIVAAQEFQWVFCATKHTGTTTGGIYFRWAKEERRVGVYYFYVLDREFGPGFIKICTYFPYPAKVWINGHEWAKHQARRARHRLHRAGQRVRHLCPPGPAAGDLRPLRPGRRRKRSSTGGSPPSRPHSPTPIVPPATGGSCRCAKSRCPAPSCSTTLAAPAGSSKRWSPTTSASAALTRWRWCSPARCAVPPSTPTGRRVFGPGTDVKIDFSYKHSRVKQYLKEGRALRIETVINKPSDIDVLARLEHLPELVAKAREVNRRLLIIERAGQGCAIGSALFERIHQPYNREGQRTGAFRFGDPRAMALAGALCCVVHAVTGFTNQSLRGLVAGLLGHDYSANQMTYDLRRLRLHGIIERVPHTHTYRLTPEGIRVAVFYTKVHRRLLGPLLEADHPPAPPNLRRALATIDRNISDYITNARLGTGRVNLSQRQGIPRPSRTRHRSPAGCRQGRRPCGERRPGIIPTNVLDRTPSEVLLP